MTIVTLRDFHPSFLSLPVNVSRCIIFYFDHAFFKGSFLYHHTADIWIFFWVAFIHDKVNATSCLLSKYNHYFDFSLNASKKLLFVESVKNNFFINYHTACFWSFFFSIFFDIFSKQFASGYSSRQSAYQHFCLQVSRKNTILILISLWMWTFFVCLLSPNFLWKTTKKSKPLINLCSPDFSWQIDSFSILNFLYFTDEPRFGQTDIIRSRLLKSFRSDA